MTTNDYLPGSPVVPNSLLITAITNAYNSVVTVAIANLYIPGQLIKLTVPPSYGMDQADQLTGEILSINGLDFTTSIDTSQFAPFVVPANYKQKPASLAPAGAHNLYNTLTVPFHALDGTVGN